MANTAPVTVRLGTEIQIKFANAEKALESLEKQFKQIDPGSAIGTSLAKTLVDTRAQVKQLGKAVKEDLSGKELEKFNQLASQMGKNFLTLRGQMSKVSFKDLGSSEEIEHIRQMEQELREYQNRLKNFKQNSVTSFKESKEYKDTGLDPTKTKGISIENYKKQIDDAVKEINKEIEVARGQLKFDELLTKNDAKRKTANGKTSVSQSFYKGKEKELTGLVEKLQNNVIDGKSLGANGGKKVFEKFFQDLGMEFTQEREAAIDAIIKSKGKKKVSAEEIAKSMLGEGKLGGQAVFNRMAQAAEEQRAKIAGMETKKQVLLAASDKAGSMIASEAQNKSLLEQEIAEKGTAIEQAKKNALEAINNNEELTKSITDVVSSIEAAAERIAELIQTAQAFDEVADARLKAVAERENANVKEAEEQKRQEAAAKKKEDAEIYKTGDAIVSQRESKAKEQAAAAKALEEEEKVQTRMAQERQSRADHIQGAIRSWLGLTQIINTAHGMFQTAISDIQGLDKAMTGISVVTNMSNSDLWGQINEYMAVAQQYGVTTQGVYEVSQLYYQMGLQTSEVTNLTTQTLEMARIAGISYSSAADYMTNALRAFHMEMSQANEVVDTYSKLASVSASSTEEIAIAMTKTANSAYAVGSSFENTSAMISLMVGNSAPCAA